VSSRAHGKRATLVEQGSVVEGCVRAVELRQPINWCPASATLIPVQLALASPDAAALASDSLIARPWPLAATVGR